MRYKRLLLLGWLALPLAVAVWRANYGEPYEQRDRAAGLLARAKAAQAAQRNLEAAGLFASAADALPAGAQRERDTLLLAAAGEQLAAGEITEAAERLDQILDSAAGRADEQAVAESARGQLAAADYQIAWLMRLEGASAEEWEAPAESARQHFRLLAESGGAAKDPNAPAFQQNLECVIRLQEMDLSELRGLPLPKNCCNCKKNISQRRRKQRENDGRSQPQPQQQQKEAEKDDARKEIKRVPADGCGHEVRKNGGS